VENKSMIEKTFESTGFLTGGELNPTQQSRFIVLVKKFSRLLSMVRFIPMARPKQTIDKMHISEPVTISIAENTNTTDTGSGKFNQIELIAQKVISQWSITTESLQSNIEQVGFEDTLMETMTERIATDLELLAIQGDDTLVGTNPTEMLLKRLDGWDILTNNSHIVDADGDSVSKNLFAAMIRSMPKQFKNDPGLRFLVSDTVANDWMNLLSERGTAVGDAALGGTGINPFGRPMVVIPLIPDDKSLSVTAATPATTQGNLFGPFVIVAGSNDEFTITDGVSTLTNGTLTAGVRETVVVAKEMNDLMLTAVASPIAVVWADNGEGNLLAYTVATGAAATFTLTAGTDDFLVTAGLTAAAYTGSNAGTAGTVYEGSFILLTNPMNLIYAMLMGTRIFSEFNKNYDRIETVVYNQVAVEVENIDAVVKAINVRREAL